MKLKNCKICSKKFDYIIDLGKQPCADTFLSSKANSKNLNKIKLAVGYCDKCKHMSNIHSVSGYSRYQKYDYSYTSNNSPVSRKHFLDISSKLLKKIKLSKNDTVVEAGSNDGFFLSAIKKKINCQTIGIDPSKKMSILAKKKGVTTINDFFNLKSALKIKKKFKDIKLFYAANVFNHADDINNFIISIKRIINKNSLIVLEVPDLENLVQTNGFDTIYHEHRHYFSQSSLNLVFNKHKLHILKFEKISYMSGSIRIYAMIKLNSKRKNIKSNLSLKKVIKFKKNILIICDTLKNKIEKLNKQNKIVVGIGAATKGNTFLNTSKINDSHIYCILESSIHKIGKYTPGSAIRIINERRNIKFDFAVILPWNISKFLIKKFNLKKNYISVKTISDKLKNAKDNKN